MQRIAKCYWVALKALLTFTDGDTELHFIWWRWNQVVLSWYESTYFELVKLVDIHTFWIGVTEYHYKFLEKYIIRNMNMKIKYKSALLFQAYLDGGWETRPDLVVYTDCLFSFDVAGVPLSSPGLIGCDDVTGWSRSIWIEDFTLSAYECCGAAAADAGSIGGEAGGRFSPTGSRCWRFRRYSLPLTLTIYDRGFSVAALKKPDLFMTFFGL